MTEAEIDEIIEKLMNNMFIVEEKIGLELARQKRVRDILLTSTNSLNLIAVF